MALVFVIIVAALAFTLTMPKKYEYTIIYTIAEANVETPLESGAGL